MKKYVYLVCCVVLLFLSTITADAGNIMSQNGHTEEEIYYRIFEIDHGINIFGVSDSRKETICVVFSEIIIPPRTRDYVKVYTGKTYVGKLYLQSATYQSGKTYAYYSGTLTLQE